MKRRNLGIALAVSTIMSLSIISVETFAFSANINNLVQGGNQTGEGEENNKGEDQLTPPTSNIQSKDVIISSVAIDEEVVEPGIPFTLTFKIENISGNIIQGLSLKIVNVEGKGTLDGFMPVGTTNEIYVGSIAKNDIKYVSITLASDPSIKAGVHNFVTSVTFNEKGEDPEEITKVVGIMVQNTPSLSISGLMPSESMVSAALRNDSKTKIKNVNAKVTMDGEVFEQNIGSIDIEGEEYMDISISPSDLERNADIEVTYEDATGKQYVSKSSCKIPPMMQVEVEPDKKTKLGLISFIKSLFGF